jgi:RimJ/RimL family protein N-acetyltransferase
MSGMHVFLETDRLVLRRFTMEDADLLVELDSDPDVMRYVDDGLPVSRQDILENTLPAFLSYYERYDGYGFWAAVEKETGRFVGWFHFRPGPDAGPLSPELGYRLHTFAWDRGLATEGSLALVDFGFAELGVERVTAEAMAAHRASRRVMKKAGLRLVRTLKADRPVRIPGDDAGDVEYALERAEWEAGRTGGW